MTGPGDTNDEAKPIVRVEDTQQDALVRIKVNGIELDVRREVVVREVLEAAKGRGAIAGSVEEYVMERVTVEGEIGPGETITVIDLEEFMAVPIGKTEVA